METKFEKQTKFGAAFDHCDDPKMRQYGRSDMKCEMVLIGKKGAVGFVFGTNMYMEKTYRLCPDISHIRTTGIPYMGYDVGYHSKKRMNGYEYCNDSCEYLGGEKCYGDGSALRANKWVKILVEKGSDAIWRMLEEYYNETFYETNPNNKESDD